MNNDEWNYLLSFQVWKLVDRQIQIHVCWWSCSVCSTQTYPF